VQDGMIDFIVSRSPEHLRERIRETLEKMGSGANGSRRCPIEECGFPREHLHCSINDLPPFYPVRIARLFVHHWPNLNRGFGVASTNIRMAERIICLAAIDALRKELRPAVYINALQLGNPSYAADVLRRTRQSDLVVVSNVAAAAFRDRNIEAAMHSLLDRIQGNRPVLCVASSVLPSRLKDKQPIIAARLEKLCHWETVGLEVWRHENDGNNTSEKLPGLREDSGCL